MRKVTKASTSALTPVIARPTQSVSQGDIPVFTVSQPVV